MKKILRYHGMLLTMALIVILSNIRIAAAQDKKEQSSPLPEDINKIFHTSCMPCHWNDGKKMALSRVNFSKWSEYDAAKEAKKASLICSTLNKGKMPPRKVRKSVPEIVPTKEQVDLICKWAESLKSK